MGFNASLAFGAYLVFAAVFLFVIMFGENEMFQGTIVERIHYWTTEGWWNIAPRACETLLRGTLAARFYYVHAVDYDRGGEWTGKSVMCTRNKEFTIRGIEDCLARGYERAGFFEVDTGEQKSWTIQLTDTTGGAPARP